MYNTILCIIMYKTKIKMFFIWFDFISFHFISGLERDSDDFLMIEYTDQDTNASIGSAWTRDPFIPWSELMGESSNVNNDSSGQPKYKILFCAA